MPKRAALLFDQLMVALQKVVDNQGKGELGDSRPFTRSSGPHLHADPSNSQIVPSADEQTVSRERLSAWTPGALDYRALPRRISGSRLSTSKYVRFASDGLAATRTVERTGVLALLLQRGHVLQEKVITTQSHPRSSKPDSTTSRHHASSFSRPATRPRVPRALLPIGAQTNKSPNQGKLGPKSKDDSAFPNESGFIHFSLLPPLTSVSLTRCPTPPPLSIDDRESNGYTSLLCQLFVPLAYNTIGIEISIKRT